MKRIYTILLFAILTFSFYIQAATQTLNQTSGSFGVQNSAYVDNMSEIWDINTGSPKAVKFTFSLNSEEGYDYLLIYSVDNNGVLSCIYNSSGYDSGTVTTILPTGKARVVFTSDGSVCNDEGYTGFTTSFSVDNSYYISQDLQVTGKSFLNGNVGIGNSNPQFKLDVSGDIQLNGKLGIGLADLTSYDNRTFGNYSIGWYSDSWTGTGPTLWQSAWGGMKFFTNSLPRLSITNSGNVGVGTTTPQAKLDVGAFLDGGSLGTVMGRLLEGNTTGDGTYLGVKGYETQGASFNNKSFSIEHHFYGQTNSSINFYRGGGMTGGFITFNTSDNTEKMRINANGKVSIGTSDEDFTPNVMLTVKGAIHAREVIVDLTGPLADYVFKSSYKLMPLHQVEQFVKTNSHLPEIPSAAEVQKNGLSIGEMQNKLLQKIEELTLYVIEQQKRIEQLERK